MLAAATAREEWLCGVVRQCVRVWLRSSEYTLSLYATLIGAQYRDSNSVSVYNCLFVDCAMQPLLAITIQVTVILAPVDYSFLSSGARDLTVDHLYFHFYYDIYAVYDLMSTHSYAYIFRLLVCYGFIIN